MGNAAGQGKVILVVEDDPLTREALTSILSSVGHSVRGAADGGEALALLRQGPLPDLIVLDLLMPGMDGWHFRREQLREPALANVPAIVCSGTGDADLHAAALGAAAFLDKPIDPDRLLATIERILGARLSR